MQKLFLLPLLLTTLLYGFQVQKPQTYTQDDNVTGWLMSEKLDGIRGYWDGKQLLSKNGNLLNPPTWFIKNFPPFALDGELWSKRGEFEKIQSIVLTKEPSKRWQALSYNIFEVPHAKGDFVNRLQKAKEWFSQHPNPYVHIIAQHRCKNKAHLQKYLDNIVAKGGEGVIVKDPDKPYSSGRSSALFKVKKTYDMEGIVTGHNLRDDGSLKSLQIRLQNGVNFNLGTGFSDVQRADPPKIGQLVTFKYYGFTKNGKPKFASFLRIRKQNR
ncbi:MAG: DNA ligase [Campylobacterota bacterium]